MNARLPEELAQSESEWEHVMFLWRAARFIEDYKLFIGSIDQAPITAELNVALKKVEALGLVVEARKEEA